MQHDSVAVAAAGLHFREGIWGAAPEDAVKELEIRKRWFGPVLATTCGGLPDCALMNVVQGAAEPGAVADGHLVEALEWIRSREVDYLVQVASDRPESKAAEAWLAARGYEQGPTMRRYLRAAAAPAANGEAPIDIHELTAADTEGMSLIFAEAIGVSDLATVPLLGLPEIEGWRCYSAYLDGYEVACGAMLIKDGIAMLGLDATAPQARRRGCQSALIRRRLLDAERAGCHTVLAEACDVRAEGLGAAGNLLRAGFIEMGRSVTWQRPALPSPN